MNHLVPLLSYLLIATVLTFALIPPYVRMLWKYKLGKSIREEALVGKATEFAKLHKDKAGTPTMGGGVILLSIGLLVAASVFVVAFAPEIRQAFGVNVRFSLWNRNETYLTLFTLFAVGAVGLVDDYLNVRGIGRTKGLSGRVKMVLLLALAAVGAYWFHFKLGKSSLDIPLFGIVDVGYLYLPFFVFVIVAMANAVNVTDGLDGLAG